ncbi:MAG: hypothetical protein JRG85_04455 [Deltaproteobacteria bacterium]|nr:hypothetical protein [Deltaproteobacteria bacterium]
MRTSTHSPSRAHQHPLPVAPLLEDGSRACQHPEDRIVGGRAGAKVHLLALHEEGVARSRYPPRLARNIIGDALCAGREEDGGAHAIAVDLSLGLFQLAPGIVAVGAAPRRALARTLYRHACPSDRGDRIGPGVLATHARLEIDHGILGLAQVRAHAVHLALQVLDALGLGAAVDRGVAHARVRAAAEGGQHRPGRQGAKDPEEAGCSMYQLPPHVHPRVLVCAFRRELC